MQKLVFFLSLFLIVSCGVQKNINQDPYVGSYEITVFEVDNFGDIELFLEIKKEADAYLASIKPQNPDQEVEFEIQGTTLDEGVFTIEAYASGYDIYFEISIYEDAVSGSLMGMFDLEGSRINK
jgi:hypothetical protein